MRFIKKHVLFLLALAWSLAAALPAQRSADGIVLRGFPPVAQLGETIEAELVIATRGQPSAPQIPTVDGLQTRIRRPSASQSVVTVNGRRRASYTVTYPIEVTARLAGSYTFGPIVVKIGDKTFKTRKRTLEVVAQIEGKQFGTLTIVPSRKRVYVHEPLRFDIECGVDAGVTLETGRWKRWDYVGVDLTADWLSGTEGLEPIEEKLESDDFVIVQLNDQVHAAKATIGRNAAGKSYRLFTYHQTLLPTVPGVKRLAAPVMRIKSLKTVGRNVFGEPVQRRKLYFVYGEPMEIEVVGLPTKGRPDPYYGAVGRFQIQAAVDKSRLRIKDSLKLTLTITGSGNMKQLSVPPLDELPGFHLRAKTVNATADQVVATYDLAPETVDVREVPAIGWNYFDTSEGVERYVTTETPAFPLTVLALKNEETLNALPGATRESVTPGVDDIFDLKLAAGAPALLLPKPPGLGRSLLGALLPWGVCLLGLMFWRARRRSLADVTGRRSRGALRKFESELASGTSPLDALCGYLADRLGCQPAAVIGPDLAQRLVAAGVDAERATELQSHVDAGVGARYSGQAEGAVISADALRDLVCELEKVEVRSPSAARLSIWFLFATFLGFDADLVAQDPLAQNASQKIDLPTAEKAYRARDYDTAAVHFAAAAGKGDRRAAYNLGNCRFRQGRYAQALAAYERARLGMPRDPELLGNMRLCRERLELTQGDSEPFLHTIADLRDSLTTVERFWLCILLNLLAAVMVCLGGRRIRVLGWVVALPALMLVLELAVLAPLRPARGIVIAAEAALVAEPSAEMQTLKKIRGGVAVEVLGATPGWTIVSVDGRKGYLPAAALAIIE